MTISNSKVVAEVYVMEVMEVMEVVEVIGGGDGSLCLIYQ